MKERDRRKGVIVKERERERKGVIVKEREREKERAER